MKRDSAAAAAERRETSTVVFLVVFVLRGQPATTQVKNKPNQPS